jgi:hypothetical protein
MNIPSRRLLIRALFLLLLLGACNMPTGTTPVPIVTHISTSLPTYTAQPSSTSDRTSTPFIPITGMEVVSMQCQFCVNEDAHAILVMSRTASFNVADPNPGITCLSAQEVNDRRILLCRGAQLASFTLNVCVGESNCLQFPVTLQTCPLIPQTGMGTPQLTFTPLTPVLLTPINTPAPPVRTPKPPTSESTPQPVPTSTGQSTEPPTEIVTEPPTVPAPTEPPSTQPPTLPPTQELSNIVKK